MQFFKILNSYTKTSIFSYFLLILVLIIIIPFPDVFAHLEHSSAGGQLIGKYNIIIGLEPEYARPGESTPIEFSIQDLKGNDIQNIQTIVEIYENSLKNRIFVDSWEQRKVGDFEIDYTFEKIGTYQVVLSISENTEPITMSRLVSSEIQDCDCTRVIFNVSISDYWFNLWNGLMIIVVVLPCTVFGIAFAMNYLNLRKKEKKYATSKQEVLKYFVVFLALAGGLIHMAIYIDHAQLRIEYALFLLLTAISQIGFGVLFLTVLMFESSTKIIKSGESNYKKNTMIYLFGLIGSVILVGLYTYVITFTLPLSTYIHPEDLEISGIVAKSLEISLIVIITYLLYWEYTKKKLMDIIN